MVYALDTRTRRVKGKVPTFQSWETLSPILGSQSHSGS